MLGAKQENDRQSKKSLIKDKLAALVTNYGHIWQDIWAMDFPTLREALQLGDLKAIDVLHAFQWRAVYTDDKLNCVIEVISKQ